ncbi:hypothetical protein jhhlp_008186 [Lomentospora prolificans]|uniref:Rhodopsin domain-containing protein n=1 Tax=Lomentospora prolificans TaxID=41688 RepID=A0A2N3MZR3_9PEZI|nr:hypothetical protein jhhlp_008185 [Lomentospora prolificans]PKS05667.1 hypothetical protein jhhlp_008186 [Lomentospora prolificans]
MDAASDVPIHKSGRLDRSHEVFIVQLVFLILSGLCLLMRGYIKCFVVKLNLLDDYLIYGAMLGYLVYSVIVIDGAYNGALGKHPSIITSIDEAARALRTWYLTMVLYPWITLTIRASVCVLLLRLNTKKIYFRAIWGLLIANVLFSLSLFFVLLLQCSPPRYFWRQLYGESGTCFNRIIVTHSVTIYSVLSALSDWFLGLLPIAILWSVQINLRTKAAIAGLLSLGMIAGIVLIVRITYMTRLQPGLRFLYEATDVAVWSVMEAALGITASCVATFRPLLKGCGFGWNSRRGYSDHIQLHEQPQSSRAFAPVVVSPGSDHLELVMDNIVYKARPNGFEHELSICEKGRIQITSAEPIAKRNL